jgi:hypothetical protein
LLSMKVFEKFIKNFFFPVMKVKKEVKKVVEEPPLPIELIISEFLSNGKLTVLFNEDLLNPDELGVSLGVMNKIKYEVLDV